MGFCGFTLYTSTLTAAVLGIILSIYGTTWTGYVLAFFRGDVPITNLTNPFQLITFNSTNERLAFTDIITTSMAIHIIWLITSVLLIVGNKKSIQSLILIWISVTSVIIVTDLSGMGYFMYRAIDALPHYSNNTQLMELMNDTVFLSYIIIAALFSKLGTILHLVLTALMVYAYKRRMEIRKEMDSYMKNHRYSYSSTDSVPSNVAEQQRVIYTSRELIPPSYPLNNAKEISGYALPGLGQKFPNPPMQLRSDSLKANYGQDNFGFAIPHLPHPSLRSNTGRRAEPKIDYEDNVRYYTSRDYRY